jgi:hypothetical protein
VCPPFLREGPAEQVEAKAQSELAKQLQGAKAGQFLGQRAEAQIQALWDGPQYNQGLGNYYTTTNTTGPLATSYTANTLRTS